MELKEENIGAGRWVKERRLVAAVQLVGVRIVVVQLMWVTDF